MLKIGYVRLRDERSADDAAALKAFGCHVVRTEEAADAGPEGAAVLAAILDFISEDDELVVTRLDHLTLSTTSALDVINRLDAKGARLLVLEPELHSCGVSGKALRAALEAVASAQPPWPQRRRRGPSPEPEQIRALHRAGVGPVEIARRLGVSRMTVWRKLRATQDA